jgi:hypothetical protein
MYIFICGSVGKMIFHIFQISEMHFVFTCAMTKNIGTVATHGHSTSLYYWFRVGGEATHSTHIM